jgi:hypothetical protein
MPSAVFAETLGNLRRSILLFRGSRNYTLRYSGENLRTRMSSTPAVSLFPRTGAQVTVLHTLQVGNRSPCTVVYSAT